MSAYKLYQSFVCTYVESLSDSRMWLDAVVQNAWDTGTRHSLLFYIHYVILTLGVFPHEEEIFSSFL